MSRLLAKSVFGLGLGVWLLWGGTLLLSPQDPQDSSSSLVSESTSKPSLSSPSIKFALKFPGSNPESYSIEIGSDGRAVYDSLARSDADSDSSTPFHWDFSIANSNRDRIFDLARDAKFFTGNLDSGRKLAFTGRKTLQFNNGPTPSSATYNYSDNKSIQELTSYFEGIALTLELVRRLDYDLRFQKLALDTELKSMEAQLADRQLSELQAAGPVLQRIAADPGVMKTVRAKAQLLAERGKAAN